jgi:hypothetical protein
MQLKTHCVGGERTLDQFADYPIDESGQLLLDIYNRAMHLTQVLSIGGVLSEPPPTQEFFRRNRAEIDGLLD